MKHRLSLYVVLLMVLKSLTLFSCLEKDNETVIIPQYLESIPESLIPASMVDSLRIYMTINEGKNPPVIEGGFMASPMALVYASDSYQNNNFYSAKLMFSSQSCRNTVCYCEEQYTAQMVCDEAMVIGNGNQFTFAGQTKMVNRTAGWSCTLGLLISGEMAADGFIRDLEYANVMLEKDDPNNVLLDVGDYRIYRDQDNTTALFDWQPGPQKEPHMTNIMR